MGGFGGVIQKPASGAKSVGHGFLGGEGFRGHHEEGRFRIQAFQCLGDVGTVDVGNEMNGQAIYSIGPQCFGDHYRTQIRTADADIDNVGNLFSGIPFPFSGDYPI